MAESENQDVLDQFLRGFYSVAEKDAARLDKMKSATAFSPATLSAKEKAFSANRFDERNARLG